MKTALNADEDFAARYVASNAAGVLTVTALRKGTGMNGTTFAASKVGTGTFTAAGATMTGGLLLDLLSLDDKPLPQGRSGRPGRYQPRKPAKAAAKADKLKRKVIRKRR